MKVYWVKPNSYFVRVSDGRQLEFVERTAPLAIVADVIGDEMQAKNYLRFTWRWYVFDGWANLKHDCGVTEDQVREIIAQIDGSVTENEKIAQRVDRERPTIANDMGVYKKQI